MSFSEYEQKYYNQCLNAEKVLSPILIYLSASQNTHLEGFLYRLKEPASILSKIYDRKEVNDICELKDINRYTIICDTENFKEQVNNICNALQFLNIDIIKFKNTMSSRDTEQPYAGLNCQLEINGHKFELQFHTPDSYYIKQNINHQLYEIVRNPLINIDRDVIIQKMINNSNSITFPNIEGIETSFSSVNTDINYDIPVPVDKEILRIYYPDNNVNTQYLTLNQLKRMCSEELTYEQIKQYSFENIINLKESYPKIYDNYLLTQYKQECISKTMNMLINDEILPTMDKVHEILLGEGVDIDNLELADIKNNDTIKELANMPIIIENNSQSDIGNYQLSHTL